MLNGSADHIGNEGVKQEIEFTLCGRSDLSVVFKPSTAATYGSCCWRGTGILMGVVCLTAYRGGGA